MEPTIWAVGLLEQFAPHGYCFAWTPTLLWGMITADLLTTLSYYSIPIALIYFAQRRGLGSYNHLLWKFGLFIFLCGTSHLIYLWNIWHGHYFIEMIAKLMTGIVSFYVAVSVWQIMPAILKIPSVKELEAVNAELKNSENRYHELLDTVKEGVWQLDSDGNTLLANRSIADILGISVNELHNTRIQQFISNPGVNESSIQLQKLLRGETQECELNFVKSDGTSVSTTITANATYDKSNQFVGTVAVVSDLTERDNILKDLSQLNRDLEKRVLKRTEELRSANSQLAKRVLEKDAALDEQREAKARLDAVFNASPNGIIITDKAGVITDANIAIEAMFGYLKTDLIGQHVNILTPKEFADEHNAYIQSADASLTTKKLGFGRKLLAQRRYNVDFPVDVALTKMAHSDKHYYMAVIRDLTEIDKVEEELRSVNEKLLKTVHSLEEKSNETKILNEYTEMLESCTDHRDYGDIIRAYCSTVFNATDAQLYTMNENKLTNVNPKNQEMFNVDDCWALKLNKLYPINDRQRQIKCRHLSDNHKTMCLPLNTANGLLGMITLTFAEQEQSADATTAVNLAAIQAFAVRTSISMASLKLLREKELQSYKDELTGLYNRRFMNESLAKNLLRAKRDSNKITLLIIDIDYFKSFNDNYGHNLGDSALVQVAHCISLNVRESDLVCRMGGEEFVIIMYDASEDDGLKKAQDIHDAIDKINNLPMDITVSIGVAELNDHDDAETLIRNADIALYKAKNNGRNQTSVYSSAMIS